MKAIIFDIDGTLADVNHRLHHLPNWPKFFADMDKDPVVEPVAATLRSFFHGPDNYQVIIVSARPDDYRLITGQWLDRNFIPYHRLYMRKSGDFRKDSIVKAEILEQIISDGYNPFLVIDDRPEVVEMWRSYGICTLQCAADDMKGKHDGVHCLDVLVGPSGAGKSTWVQQNAKPHDIISTDALREQYGWGHSPEDLNKTWSYAHSLLKARLENQIYTVFDATNIKRKDRLNLLHNVPKGQYVKYIVIDRPLDEKMKDRGSRSEELVLKHHRTFTSQVKHVLMGDELPNVVVEDKRKK